ncbi:hypothetical protein ERJ75_000267300 [Trypanosoma vivax]|nr:hypothetical protein ERJ75_000267300 [Trypanosoma vivax]
MISASDALRDLVADRGKKAMQAASVSGTAEDARTGRHWRSQDKATQPDAQETAAEFRRLKREARAEWC